MSITRTDLESQRLQTMLAQANPDLTILSDAQLQASISDILNQRSHPSQIWIFAYGSLIWNPVFEYQNRQIAKLDGWHRSFCIWTPAGRGTPKQPGLVLGLEESGHCCGVAYQITADPSELLLLWRREMVVGSYIPRWVELETSNQKLDAIAFTMNPQHSLYAANLTLLQTATAISKAQGSLGSCTTYLMQTIEGLAELGIVDLELMKIHEQVMFLNSSEEKST
jgi:cation transport protein ChaC